MKIQSTRVLIDEFEGAQTWWDVDYTQNHHDEWPTIVRVFIDGTDITDDITQDDRRFICQAVIGDQ